MARPARDDVDRRTVCVKARWADPLTLAALRAKAAAELTTSGHAHQGKINFAVGEAATDICSPAHRSTCVNAGYRDFSLRYFPRAVTLGTHLVVRTPVSPPPLAPLRRA